MTGDGDYPAPFVVDVLNTGQWQILWCSSMFKNTGNMTRLVEASEKVGNMFLHSSDILCRMNKPRGPNVALLASSARNQESVKKIMETVGTHISTLNCYCRVVVKAGVTSGLLAVKNRGGICKIDNEHKIRFRTDHVTPCPMINLNRHKTFFKAL